MVLADLKTAFHRIEVGDQVEVIVARGIPKVNISFVAQSNFAVFTKAIILILLPGFIFCYALCLIGNFVLLKRIHDRTAQFFLFDAFFLGACHAQDPGAGTRFK